MPFEEQLDSYLFAGKKTLPAARQSHGCKREWGDGPTFAIVSLP